MIYLVVWATLLQLGRKVGGGDVIAKYIACTCTYTVWQYYCTLSDRSYLAGRLLAKGIKIQSFESFITYKTNEAISYWSTALS